MDQSELWADFKPNNTCLLIIDMQKDFLDEGAPVEIGPGRDIIPSLARLLAEARKRRTPVIHLITEFRADGIDVPPFNTGTCLNERGLREGTEGVKESEGLRPVPGEYTVIKKRYSGFLYTDLELLLSLLRMKNLIMTGVATNYCVRSTVHDACFRGYRSVVTPECTASYTLAEHEASLKDIDTGFGYVVGMEELIKRMAAW